MRANIPAHITTRSKTGISLILLLVLSLCFAPSAYAQDRALRQEEIDAINEAIRLLRDLGFTDQAGNVQNYLNNSWIQVRPGMSEQGLTVRDPFGAKTIYLNPRLFLSVRSDIGWVRFSAIVDLAATLVHGKYHAEEQTLLGNVAAYIGGPLIGSGDIPEGEAYAAELLFLIAVKNRLRDEWNTLVGDWNAEVTEFNKKAEGFDPQHPSKELANDMLAELTKLKDKLTRLDHLRNKLTQVLNSIRSVLDALAQFGWGEEASVARLRQATSDQQPFFQQQAEKLTASANNLKLWEELLKGIDPDPTAFGSLDLVDLSVINELRGLTQQVQQQIASSAQAILSPGKLGLSAPFFQELARLIVEGKVNVYLVMEKRGDLIMTLVPFSILVQDSELAEVLEAPYDRPDYRLHATDRAIIEALLAPSISEAIASQLARQEITLSVPQEKATELAERVSSLEKEVLGKTSEFETLRADFEALRAEVGATKAALEATKSDLTAAVVALEGTQAELVAARDELAAAQQALVAARGQLQTVTSLYLPLAVVVAVLATVLLAYRLGRRRRI